MDTHDEVTQSISEPVNEQFYGLTDAGKILVLPLAAHAASALRFYHIAREGLSEDVENIPMIFSEHQYRAVMSAVDAELSDADGDEHIPVFMVIPYSTQLAVFPHSSVDTEEEALEFIEGYPLEVIGPFKLTDVRDNWPRPAEVEVPAVTPEVAE